MKRLIALLFLAPAFASAQLNNLSITSGSMVLTDLSATWTVAGDRFSSGGTAYFVTGGPIGPSFSICANPGIACDQPLGWTPTVQWGTNDSVTLGLTVDGVGDPQGGSAFFDFGAAPTAPIFGVGAYKTPFTFEEDFGCFSDTLAGDVPGCTPYQLTGSGIMTLYVIADPTFGFIYPAKATFAFSGASVAEPSTAALMLIALAGLALLGRDRRARATLLPAG